MTSSIIVRKEEVIGDIDPKSISRSVFVTGFNPATKSEDLIIHFQRKKNGGGDIDGIVISKKGTAVITFDDPKVVSSLLQHEQKFGEIVLTVAPYLDTLLSKHEKYFEVFELVSAELCSEFVEYLSRKKTRALLKDMKARTGVVWIESSENFIMSGTFKEVEEAHSFLQENARQSYGIVVSDCPKRNESGSEESEDVKSSFDDKDDTEEDVSQNGPATAAANKEIHRPESFRDETHEDPMVNSTSPDSMGFEIQPRILEVFVKAHKKDLEDIEIKYHVEIPRKADGKKLSLRPKDSCTTEYYEQACNQFISLYQNTYQQVKMQRFSLKTETNTISARKTISKMSKHFPVSVEVEKNQKQWGLYGEASHIEEALRFLENEGVEINREREDEKGRRKKAKDFEEDMEVDPRDPPADPGHQLEAYILGGKIKLSVYKDDITKQRVDVIVNAANRELQHDGGVAAAILAKGGRTIEEESQAISRNRGFLKDGETVVTNSGKLPCKAVVHAVGPRCNDVGAKKSKKILRQACLNSFIETEKLNMTSIALPAIGSGINGMPKDVCAEVMFNAVDEYARQGDAKKKRITDIRFVNIDDPSVQAFSKELKKRYGVYPERHRLEKETGGDTSGRSPSSAGAEGGRSAVPPSRSNRGRGQSRDNRHATNRNDTGIGYHGHSSFGSSAANSHHPLMNPSDHPTTTNSYSNAVKGNTRSHDMKLLQDHQPQRNGGTGGFSIPFNGGDGAHAEKKEEEVCPICLDQKSRPRSLKCKHSFCSECIQAALNVCNKCPVCQQPQGVIVGNQPRGQMTFRIDRYSVPGYEGFGTIVIDYYLPSGLQGPEHPNPGQSYQGTSRTAYLPNNREGQEVLQLLRRAFDARLVFTVGTSITSGLSNQVIWNDIHHKTNRFGVTSGFGYPDPDYLRRVKEELAAKGIR